MQPTVYLETTIPSYLVAWQSRDLIVAAHQQITQEWWREQRHRFELRISQFVLDEAADGDPVAAQQRMEVLRGIPLLDVTDAVADLAESLLETGLIPAKAATDAAHIAVAAVHGSHFLLTWNCKHINNAEIYETISNVCRHRGFVPPVVCSPEELMGISP